MNGRIQSTMCLFFLSVIMAALEGRSLFAATISLEPGSVQVQKGGLAEFDVYLSDYQPSVPSEPILSFGLSVAASDMLLTSSNTDFSRFSFALDPGLAGVLGGIVFDGVLSDDGRVEFGADLPSETGILASQGDTLLGVFSIQAPNTEGTFTIDLSVDDQFPILDGGTFLTIDDGSPFGRILPGDGELSVESTDLIVVPEPTAVALVLIFVAMDMLKIKRKWL